MIEIIKSIEGKRFLPEILPKKIPEKGLRHLIPVRDIDDEFVSYSTQKMGHNIGATTYDDIFEHMSFETPRLAEKKNTFRMNELFDKRNESSKTYISSYDQNDLPLSDSIMDRLYGGQNKIKNRYYPDTDMTEGDIKTLKLIDFIENIVPSSIDKKLNLEYKTIYKFAKYATDALVEDGIPTPEIRKILTKSVLKSSNETSLSAEPELFEFLSRYPKDRATVVKRDKDGNEFFDKAAAMYLKIFDTKYFNSLDTARAVLEECKSYSPETGYKMVDRSLCNIATMLRRRTAQGLESLENSTYYLEQPMARYCEPSFPWTKANSRLLEKLKPNGVLDENAYHAAKYLLSGGNTVIDTTNYLDDLVAKKAELNKLKTKLVDYKGTLTQRETLGDLLSYSLGESMGSISRLAKPEPMFVTVNKMLDKSYSISDITTMAKAIKRTFKPFMSDNPKGIESILDAITITKSNLNHPKISYPLLESLEDFVASEEGYTPIVQKFTEMLQDNKMKLTMHSLLGEYHFSRPENFIENSEELSKYINRLDNYYKENNISIPINFVKNFLSPEILEFGNVKGFKNADCQKLNLLEYVDTNPNYYPVFAYLVQGQKHPNFELVRKNLLELTKYRTQLEGYLKFNDAVPNKKLVEAFIKPEMEDFKYTYGKKLANCRNLRLVGHLSDGRITLEQFNKIAHNLMD